MHLDLGDNVPAGLRAGAPPPPETPGEVMAETVEPVLIQAVKVKLKPLAPPEHVAVVQHHITGQPLLNVRKVRV